MDPLTKFEPVAVSVNAGPPTVAALGEMLVSDGPELVTVKVSDPDVPLPGVVTVMESEPGVLVSLAVSVAVNCVPLTNVVVRVAPLTWTTDVLTKFAPVAVRVNGPFPAMAEVGEIAVSVGMVAVTVRASGFEVQPPPSELATVNDCCPARRSLLLSWTLSCVALTKVVGRLLPLNWACESEKKLVPVRVMVCAEPAGTLEGEIALRIGMLDELWSNVFSVVSTFATVSCRAGYECPTCGVENQLSCPGVGSEKPSIAVCPLDPGTVKVEP